MKVRAIAATAFASIFVLYVISFDALTYAKPYVNAIVVGDFLTYWMPIFCTTYLVLQFCTFMALLNERFQWLNGQLKKLAFMCSKHIAIQQKLGTPFFISP